MFPALQGVFYDISKTLDVGWEKKAQQMFSVKNITNTLERNILQHQQISWKLHRAFRSHPNLTRDQTVVHQILCSFFPLCLPSQFRASSKKRNVWSQVNQSPFIRGVCCYSQPRSYNKAAKLLPKLEEGGTLITIHCRSANMNGSFVAF